ncbi:MAG: TlpA family protein disulfide reductase [Gammaproteobacteria bacterium]
MRLALLIIVFTALLLSGCDFKPEGSSLRVGMKAPSLKTKTLADVDGDFSRITTYRQPDERMYQYSLDDALATGKPVVLEFATPGHCTVCDKQLQMLKALINKYGEDILFLHMDQYQNTAAFIAYQIQGDPWTFVIDENNVVQFKQAGRLLYGELDAVIQNALAAG